MRKGVLVIQEDIYEKRCWLGLHLAHGLGATSFWRLMDHFNSAITIVNASEKELIGVPGIQPRNVAGLLSANSIEDMGREELEKVEQYGGQIIFPTDSLYSKSLLKIPDPPPVLFVRGDVSLLNKASVAMVGSRASTSYGRRVSFSLARDFAQHGAVVVSGLALGIDSEAHLGALDVNGKTIGVIGCGLDVVYPRQNRELYEKVVEKGLLVTEYQMGTQPEGFRFPARNRIISGLSEGVVVVEAAKKSGSLITAQMALDENREVFAVPGQIDSFKSEGTHWLLKQGAKLVQTATDVFDELKDFPKQGKCAKPSVAVRENENLDNEAKIILSMLEPYPIARDKLIMKTGLRPEQVSEWLLLLELDGKIELLPGDEVRLI